MIFFASKMKFKLILYFCSAIRYKCMTDKINSSIGDFIDVCTLIASLTI